MHVDVGARRVNHTTFPFAPSREKISVSNDLVNWRDNPFLVLDVFDTQWLLFFHSTYILGLQSKILTERTAIFSHNKGRRFGEIRLVTFSKYRTWEFEINYGKDKRTTVELLLTNTSTTTTLLYDAQFSLLQKIPNTSCLHKKDVSAMLPIFTLYWFKKLKKRKKEGKQRKAHGQTSKIARGKGSEKSNVPMSLRKITKNLATWHVLNFAVNRKTSTLEGLSGLGKWYRQGWRKLFQK